MSINDWPSHERPREKLLQHGAQILTDAELLAILLRTGTPGKTALDVARELLVKFGSLRALMQATRLDICEQAGLGLAKYTQLQAVLEIGRRCLFEHLSQQPILHTATDTLRYLQAELQDYPHEVFAALFLNNQHRIIRFVKLFHGTIDSTMIYPREVVKRALHENARSIIFVHNHPSGNAEPSREDIAITLQLKNALALIDVDVIDHIIIGNGQTTSFAQRGLL